MTVATSNVSGLVSEYDSLISNCMESENRSESINVDKLESQLRKTSEWTSPAAKELIRLANDYGSFMLRNALALSLALGIEDGDHGF